MRYLIISDLHLTEKFNPEKYGFLKKIIESSDKVILNGDFWDSISDCNKFFHSRWRLLFPLLKEKKAVLIYGNHDAKEFWNIDPNTFSEKQTEEFEFRSGFEKFKVLHGHQFAPKKHLSYTHGIDNKKRNMMKRYIINSYVKGYSILKAGFERTAITLSGSRFYTIFANVNMNMKKNNPIQTKGEWLICGHSHCAEVDPMNKYANSGFINHHIGQYITIENGKVELHTKRY